MATETPRLPLPLPRWPLLAILAGAVAARLWSWSWTLQMTNDGVDFLWQAQRLLAGEFGLMLRHPYHPLTGAAIAALSWITVDVLWAAVAVSVLAGALIVLAAHDLARMAFPHLRWAGPCAALLAAVHSRTMIYTSDVQSDGLFLALFLLALRMLFSGVEHNVCRRRLAAAGVLAGLAYLTRPEGLFVSLAVGLWALSVWSGTGPSRARVASGVAVFALALVVVSLPYVLVVQRTTGNWGISMKPSMSAIGLADTAPSTKPPQESPIRSPKVRRSRAANRVVETPSTPTTQQPKQGSVVPLAWGLGSAAPSEPSAFIESLGLFVNTLREDALVLAAIGFALLWHRRRGLASLVLIMIGAWLALCAYHLSQSTYLSARHVMVPTVMLLPLGGAGIAVAWNAARDRVWLTRSIRILVVLSLFAMLWSGVRARHEDHGPRLQALGWITGQTAEDERIGVHRRKDGWYAQRRVLVVPTPCDETDLLKKMRRYRVRYLVFDAGRIARHMPHWLEGKVMQEVRRFGKPGEGSEVIVLERATTKG